MSLDISAASGLRKSNARAKSTEGIAGIERRRAALAVSQARLCQEAGIAESTYWRASGGSTPQRRILVRLSRALDRIEAGRKAAPLDVVTGFYRSACVIFAGELGADAAGALAAPCARSNLDPRNRLAGKARRLAFYLTLNAYEVPRADLARAIGYSKQAASAALADIEDARGEDASLDDTINRIGHLLTGRDLA